MTDNQDKPRPGSEEAQKAGCTCPIIDNSYGKGYFGDGEKHGWWVSSDCPLHGEYDDNGD